jgi:hypothetical protein
MAKAQNTFLKSKMNKDLDARILPNGEYRDAVNVQVSKSEGAQVGSLENVLGNTSVLNIQSLTGDTDLQCIGNFADEINSTVYLFLTDYTDTTPDNPNYSPTNNSCIVSYNVLSGDALTLVRGSFLNFSTTNLITGINVLETLLFFTDNRNQPRVIDVTLANPTGLTQPLYYSSEDSISVAKYSPYKSIELWEKSVLAPTSPVPYETTMKDVSSKFLPNGGSGLRTGAYTGATSITLNAGSVTGDIMNPAPSGVYGPTATIGYIPSSGGDIIIIPNATLDPVNPPVYNSIGNTWTINITGGNFPSIPSSETYEIIINPNPYYNSSFSGDPDYLEDKFVRFSYRYRFADNTYSITAPFTQTAFIPKKDGYFMYVDGLDSVGSGPGVQTVDDESEVYRSTVVYFVENKVNSIDLRIPLPYFNYDLQNALKVSEIDILYKESDGLSVKVVETVPISDIASSAGVCLAAGAQTVSAGNPINVDNIQGGINIGDVVIGSGIPDNAFVTSFTPTNPSNPIAGTIEIDQNVVLADNDFITIGDINYFEYNYKSTKPTKTLPESELIRVYDKVPVKALAQEVAGNRVIYGNFINKHNPPNFINYNVACTPKTNFSLNEATVAYTGGAATYSAGTTITVNVNKAPGGFYAGMVITSNTAGVIIPEGTLLTSTTNNSSGAADITLDQNVTFPAGTVVLIFQPGGDILNTTSIVEYPNSSVKTNRNYQVGFVLSDRYGRQSSVILSNNKETITVNGISYSGSTIYSPYIGNIDKDQWPGNSIKLLVNELIDPANAYNGDTTSVNYNPLGWYSYKVVVKQTEQDYYNVYLPGIMAGYPEDNIIELGKTSHTVLINDNINKVPRDLSEVGPDQKQFRSSVQLFGRVQNTNILISSTNTGASNEQYYPGISSDTVTSIATAKDLFEYDATNPSQPNYFPQFYSINSNPLIARISTEKQIGEISTTNFAPASAQVEANVSDSAVVKLTNISGTVAINDLVTGGDLPEGVYVLSSPTGSPPQIVLRRGTSNFQSNLTADTVLTFTPSANPSVDPTPKHPGIQYLAVYETEPIQSLLDIYWETSTSGLISDLNSLILNNQSTPGAASFSSWNVDTFDEGLAPQSNILAQPFSLVNDFGAAITLDPSSGDYLQLLGVINGNGVSVANSNQDPSFPLALYFELVPASPTGPWQVRTTDINDATMNFYDNIFFMRNEENSFTNRLRNFTFQFKVQIDGQINYIFQQADLRNVKPLFTKITQGNTTTISGSPLTPPSIPLSPNFISVEANRDSSVIASIEFQNGAHNPNLAKPTPSWYTGGDVNVVGNEQLFPDMEIIKAKIGSNDDAAEDAFLNGEPIFGIDEDPVIGATPPVIYVKLYNFQSDNPALQAKTYYVTVRIQDAGDFQDIVFEIDMSLDLPTNVIQNQVAYTNDGNSNQNLNPEWPGQNSSTNSYSGSSSTNLLGFQVTGTGFPLPQGNPYTLINATSGSIPGLLPSQVGYYLYAGGFFNRNMAGNTNDGTALSFTRESRSLTSYYGVDSSLPLDAPPIILPFDTPNSYNHKIIKESDPSVYNFAGNTPIQVYTVGTITSIGTVSSEAAGLGENYSSCSRVDISIDSGEFPCVGMRPWCGPADGSLPTAPQASYVNYPLTPGNRTEIEIITKNPEQLSNGDIRLIFGTNLGSVGTLPNFAVGSKMYLFGGNINFVGLMAQWWDIPTGNPVFGSPWFFAPTLEKVLTMFHYSPWCGIGPLGFNDPWKDDCPTQCVHSEGGEAYSNFPANYLGVLTYAGIDCEVENYSNLNWEII